MHVSYVLSFSWIVLLKLTDDVCAVYKLVCSKTRDHYYSRCSRHSFCCTTDSKTTTAVNDGYKRLQYLTNWCCFVYMTISIAATNATILLRALTEQAVSLSWYIYNRESVIIIRSNDIVARHLVYHRQLRRYHNRLTALCRLKCAVGERRRVGCCTSWDKTVIVPDTKTNRRKWLDLPCRNVVAMLMMICVVL